MVKVRQAYATEGHDLFPQSSFYDASAGKHKVAIYTRKSNASEGRSKSREQQLQHCRQVAEQRGFVVQPEHIYWEDEGQEGYWYWDNGTGRFPTPHRPELTRMMQNIEKDKIDTVMVWDSDRLYRDNGVCDAIVQVFRRKKTLFICNYSEMDVLSSSGLFHAHTEAAGNRRQRDRASEDVQRDKLGKVQLGMFSRDPSCLGFRSRGRKTQQVEPIWEEIALVRRIFSLFVTGEDPDSKETPGSLGTNGIASYLMDQGVRWPKGTKGHKFKYPATIHESQIGTVLSNCMYVGWWRHKGLEYEFDRLLVPVLDALGDTVPDGKRETVIPLSLYEAAQEKLARRQRQGKRSLTAEHLLTGMVICARCGRPLHVHFTAYKTASHGEPRQPRANFTCGHKRGERPCPSKSICRLQEPVLDDWVLEQLAPLLIGEINIIRTSAGRDADVQTQADLTRQIKEARERETKSLSALVGVMDAEQFEGVARTLRVERESLERRAGEVEKRLQNAEVMLPNLCSEELGRMPKATLKDTLSRAIQWIAIGKEGIVILTSWGTYVGAAFRKREKSNPVEKINVTYLCKPEPATTLGCLSWLVAPAEFIRGRRDALGRKSDRFADAELLPGILLEPLVDLADGEKATTAIPYFLEGTVSLPEVNGDWMEPYSQLIKGANYAQPQYIAGERDMGCAY